MKIQIINQGVNNSSVSNRLNTAAMALRNPVTVNNIIYGISLTCFPSGAAI
jgi:hypothetical protein